MKSANGEKMKPKITLYKSTKADFDVVDELYAIYD